MRLIAGMGLVLAIIFVVPIAVYGVVSSFTGLQTPAGAPPLVFLTGVLVSKLGTAIAFVLIYHFARGSDAGRWMPYAALWWLMFAIGEIGQAIGPGYSAVEAIAGIVSESIYFPAAAFLLDKLLASSRGKPNYEG